METFYQTTGFYLYVQDYIGDWTAHISIDAKNGKVLETSQVSHSNSSYTLVAGEP